MGDYRDRCSDLWKDQDMLLMLSSTPVFTVSLVLEKQETECVPNHKPTLPPCQALPLPRIRTIQSVTMSQEGELR